MVYENEGLKRMFIYGSQFKNNFVVAIEGSPESYLRWGKYKRFMYLLSHCREPTNAEREEYRELLRNSQYANLINYLINERKIEI